MNNLNLFPQCLCYKGTKQCCIMLEQNDATHVLYNDKKKQIIWLRWEKKIECIYMITYKKDKLNQKIETLKPPPTILVNEMKNIRNNL